MIRHWSIQLGVVIACAALLTGCGQKDSDEAAKNPVPQPAPEQKDTVQLSDESLKLVTINTITVGHGKLSLTLRAPGHVSFNLNHTAKLTSTFEGRIAKMNYDVGAAVQEGDVMALIDSPEFLNKSLELKAPIAGHVIERHGTVGEIVDKGKELYTISDPTNVWVIADVNANDIAAVLIGQEATVHTTAYSDEAFAGKVVLVNPEVEEKSRTVQVRIETDNQNARLKPGMFADVEVVTSMVDNVVVIPDEAIQRLDDQEIVFVATDAHTFIKRTIKTGRAQNGNAEILDGLKDGERVVTKGSFLLKSELLKRQFGE
jgi:multidrug efflux pump subunit AcrA (membrane-fusion protein)